MDYGSFVLDPCNQSATQKVDNIQSKSLRIIAGAMKSSPINALQVECLEPPLSIRRQYLADRLFFKLVQNPNHPLLNKLRDLLDLLANFNHNNRNSYLNSNLPCLLISYQRFLLLPNPLHTSIRNPLHSVLFEVLLFHPNIILNFGIDKDTTDPLSTFNIIIYSKYEGWHTIFTDASKMSDNQPVGAAVWLPFTGIILSFKCSPSSSVFTAEATAILEAILYIKSHNLNKFLILTDSKSCLYFILSNPFRSKSNFPII